jgi:hypothetical protein
MNPHSHSQHNKTNASTSSAQASILNKHAHSNQHQQYTQPDTFHTKALEPTRKYNTRGVNLYNKFSATVDHNEGSSSNTPVGIKAKSQYSHIFENHVIEDSSSESDEDNNNSNSDQDMTDIENSSADEEEDEVQEGKYINPIKLYVKFGIDY